LGANHVEVAADARVGEFEGMPGALLVGGVLVDQVSEVSLANDEKTVQGLVLDGPYEPL
jgi:hypothetical protein